MPNPKSNLHLGYFGETTAAKYLSSLGFKIIERNFKKRYGEIDIIALDGQTLVFVEVKTRKGAKFGTAEEAITPWKMQALIRSAHYYKLLHPKLPESMRIDVVSIQLLNDREVKKITLYKNITQ